MTLSVPPGQHGLQGCITAGAVRDRESRQPAGRLNTVSTRRCLVCHPDGSRTGRRGLLSKEDRYGFKLAVGSGSGRNRNPRILHHPIHQGQSDDVVLCTLGLSQGRWLDHLAGVPQGQDCPPGSSVPPPPRHRFARCPLDGPGHSAARHYTAPPGAAKTATLSQSPEQCVSPTRCGAFLYPRHGREIVVVSSLWGPFLTGIRTRD